VYLDDAHRDDLPPLNLSVRCSPAFKQARRRLAYQPLQGAAESCARASPAVLKITQTDIAQSGGREFREQRVNLGFRSRFVSPAPMFIRKTHQPKASRR
jgi:hypothetical protein